jgi:hypothetical protein
MVDSQTNSEFESAFAPAPVVPAAPAQIAPMAPQQTGPVNVITPDGDLQSIDGSQLADALSSGFTQASPEAVDQHFREEKYGTTGQQVKTGLEGAASAATFGLSTGLEKSLGVSGEDIQARRETNPLSHAAGQVAGLVGSSFIPGLGEANAGSVLEKAGVAGAEAIGLGKATTTLGQIGSAAAKGAVENALFQAGDELSQTIADPSRSVGAAAADVGLAGLVGGVIGGGVGSISPLWKSTFGGETHGMLSQMANKLGGIEGQVESPIQEMVTKAGINADPTVMAQLSGDPVLENSARILSQSDTHFGLKHQEAVANFRSSAEDSLVNAMGKDPTKLDKLGEISEFQTGKKLANTLGDEYQAKLDPTIQEFDKFRNSYKNIPLAESVAGKADEFASQQAKAVSNLAKAIQQAQRAIRKNVPEAAVEAQAAMEEATAALKKVTAEGRAPGTTDAIGKRIMDLAEEQGWTRSPSSPEMQAVNQVMKELPLQKTLGHLTQFISQVGKNTSADVTNMSLRRAGGLMKSVMKDVEGDVLSGAIGKREGVDALGRFNIARKAYAEHSGTKDALDSVLHLGGSTAGYGKALKAAGSTDAEILLKRLARDGDASTLQLLQEQFPKTFQSIKEYQINKIIEAGMNKAKPGEKINAQVLRNAIDKMSPELRSAVFDKGSLSKVDAIGQLLDKLKDPKYNFSNTARTSASLMGPVLGGVTGAIAGLSTGHLSAAAMGFSLPGMVGAGTDAARYALLHFMGAAKPISPAGFQTALSTIQATIRGENAIAKGIKAVFSASEKVAISAAMPSDRDRAKIDAMVTKSQQDPQSMLDVGQEAGYYMPNHGTAIASTSMNALNFLASQRPNTQPAMPLDSKLPPDPGKKANYDRMLNVAAQPLLILNKIKAGSITSQEITALKVMYPGLHDNMVSKLMDTMNTSLSKGNAVPYATRIGLSMFSGSPMDSTMTPASIIAAQPKGPKQPDPSQPQAQQKPPAASSVKGLNKMATGYQTADQTRQQRAERPRQ